MITSLLRCTAAASLLAAVALAAAPATARAQFSRGSSSGPETRRVTVGLGGGASVPTTGSVRDALKTGINWHGFVGVRPTAGLPMLRFAVDYQKFDFKSQPLCCVTVANHAGAAATVATAASDAETKVLGGLANLGFDLLHGPVRPYVLAGVGAFNVKTESGGQTLSPSKTNFGIDGGAGIAVNIGRLAAFVEGRVQNVYTDRGVIDTKSITTVPVTFGLQF